METAEEWIKMLNLLPHREGGFYKEVYRSSIDIEKEALPVGFSGTHKLTTSIYFLLRSGDISKLHRLRSDEIWYFHSGSSVRIVLIDKAGQKHTKILGSRIEKAEDLQVIIPAGTIFGAEVIESNSFSVMGCMVSPGFEFNDFEVFEKEDLKQAFPKLLDVIEKFA